MSGPLFERVASTEEPEPTVFSVGGLNRTANLALEDLFPSVWVEGEISQATRAASGHVYFTLSDPKEAAQLDCVIFRSDLARSRVKLERGALVRLRGRLGVYTRRGGFQLTVRTVLPAGEGDLHAQFERIRKQLLSEGLLDPERKRSLPFLPRVIGVVTSAHGAALHDVIRVTSERMPVRIVVADCRVQGADAPRSIVAALNLIQQLPELDLVIVGRGGGSSEDLWAFNHEGVARAIASCRVPTISAIGHEVDTTIADLVADVRAATPSNAAELAVPERVTLLRQIEDQSRRLERALDQLLDRERRRLSLLKSRLPEPKFLLQAERHRISDRFGALERCARRRLRDDRARFDKLNARLLAREPRAALSQNRARAQALNVRLSQAMMSRLAEQRLRHERLDTGLRTLGPQAVVHRRQQVSLLAGRLNALSPLRVLERGFAIALSEGSPLLQSDHAPVGSTIEVILHQGRLRATVDETHGDKS